MNATGSGFSYIHVEPMTSKNIVTGLTKHYTRNFKGGFAFLDPKTNEPVDVEVKATMAMDKGPKHIDYTRSKDNEILVGHEGMDVMKTAMEKVTGEQISDAEWSRVRKYDRKKATVTRQQQNRILIFVTETESVCGRMPSTLWICV